MPKTERINDSHAIKPPAAYLIRCWRIEMLDRWRFKDETTAAVAGKWLFDNGELQQIGSAYSESGDPSKLDKSGTKALAGNLSWDDYRVSVQLASSIAQGDIGVFFRYIDENNYYRFSMGYQDPYRRLIKKEKGVVSLIRQTATRILNAVNQEYIITLDCLGDQLRGYVNAILQFDEVGTSLSAGQIGLCCWHNSGTHFLEVQAVSPTWHPYYAFNREAQLPVGTQVKVFAGNAKNQTKPKPGIVHHHIAFLNEMGNNQLSAAGAHLRLVAPDNNIEHSKYFLSDNVYKDISVRILRKADGTGFFIISTVSQLTQGQYSLQLSYRRDDRQIDPNSQVLS